MRKNNPKYNGWKKRRSKLIWEREYKRKEKNKNSFTPPTRNNNVNYEGPDIEFFNLPNRFSIYDNFEEVTRNFNQIKKTINSPSFNKKHIHFNMSSSELVRVDALMYLLTFIKNIRHMNEKIKMVGGNFPLNLECKEVVRESGFLNYLNSMTKSTYSEENIQIMAGKDVDTDIFRKILHFTHKKLNCSRLDTKDLYTLFGEIIGNANEHAYDNDSFNGWNKYLIFANYIENKVRFVILDTGEGIIKTMKKKFHEKLFPDDRALLKSALKGEFRTATELKYRGNGLPTIRGMCAKGIVKNFSLITNSVVYRTSYANGKLSEKYESYMGMLEGTLYYFDFSLGGTNFEH